jgi:hypothetical protein
VEPVTPLRHDPIPQHQTGSVGPLMRLACTCDWHGGWEVTAAAIHAAYACHIRAALEGFVGRTP